MKQKSCLLLIFLLLCVLVIFGIWTVQNITSKAEAAFGAASSNLDFTQKIYLSWRLLRSETKLSRPVNPGGLDVPFKISLGESPIFIANRLETQGIIRDAKAFRDFLVYAGLDTQLQAGEYKLSPASTSIQLAYQLLDATPTDVQFAVLAGWRLEEVAQSLTNSGLAISPEAFLRQAQRRKLEGYLLPGIYTVPRTITSMSLLDLLSTAFDEALTAELKAGFKNQGLTVDKAVRLASIIEREAVVDNEKPLIASVFLNRLAAGMKLEADPTVQYAVGFNQNQGTWWTNPLTAADLKINSPYNTYLNVGLPPGAICNPSLESLKAVALSAETPYYFFRATCDQSGKHNFAETFEDHVSNECP
jgi:UPF0755 protein